MLWMVLSLFGWIIVETPGSYQPLSGYKSKFLSPARLRVSNEHDTCTFSLLITWHGNCQWSVQDVKIKEAFYKSQKRKLTNISQRWNHGIDMNWHSCKLQKLGDSEPTQLVAPWHRVGFPLGSVEPTSKGATSWRQRGSCWYTSRDAWSLSRCVDGFGVSSGPNSKDERQCWIWSSSLIIFAAQIKSQALHLMFFWHGRELHEIQSSCRSYWRPNVGLLISLMIPILIAFEDLACYEDLFDRERLLDYDRSLEANVAHIQKYIYLYIYIYNFGGSDCNIHS